MNRYRPASTKSPGIWRPALEALEPRRALAVDTWIIDLSGSGTIDLFGPTAGGDVQAEYEVHDQSDGGTVRTSNAPGQNNPLPAAADDEFSTDEATAISGENLLAANPTTADSDPEGDPISIIAVNGNSAQIGIPVTLPSGAIVVVGATGAFDYDPNGAFEFVAAGSSAEDRFTYTIADTSGGQSTATVTVTILGSNDVPAATNLNQTVPYTEGAASVSVSDIVVTDPDVGDAITATLVLSDPSGGALTTTSGNGESFSPVTGVWSISGTLSAVNSALAAVAFIPSSGSSSNLTIATRIRDQANSGPPDGTITLLGNTVNDAPSFGAGPDVDVFEDSGPQTVNGWATAISAGPADEAGQSVTFNVTGNTNAGLFSAGPAVDAAGNLTFTPAADAFGSAVITLELVDDGGTANGGSDTSPPQSFTITITGVNDGPTFVAGADVSVLEDDGPQTISGWATGISAGAANETGQTLTFRVTGNTNPGLFVAGPTVNAAGNLTFTPAADAFGSAVITVELGDDGGTANGGSDTSLPQTFTITLGAINDAPGFVAGSDITVLEDAGPQTVSGWATGIHAGAANESGQTLTFSVTGNTSPGLFSAGPALDAAGNLTFTPAADAFGSAVITLELVDNGGTASGGSDTSPPQSFTIDVTSVNDAPSFVVGADQTASTSGGVHTVNGWASSISAGPGNESGQSLMFNIVDVSDPASFDVPPAVDSSGTLTYTPASGAVGSATITLELQDNGGTSNGGTDTSLPQAFTISFPALAISVGDHVLLPNTPNQTISIFVVGGDAVQGINFYAQIADGGPEVGGSIDGPAIQSIDMITGTIFDGNNNGPGSDLDGPHVDGFPQWEGRSVTTASGEVAADGLLATLTIDTTGFSGNTWQLVLSSTIGGPTEFLANNPPTHTLVPIIIDGSINVGSSAVPVSEASGESDHEDPQLARVSHAPPTPIPLAVYDPCLDPTSVETSAGKYIERGGSLPQASELPLSTSGNILGGTAIRRAAANSRQALQSAPDSLQRFHGAASDSWATRASVDASVRDRALAELLAGQMTGGINGAELVSPARLADEIVQLLARDAVRALV